jgi:aminopeptidase-like protein
MTFNKILQEIDFEIAGTSMFKLADRLYPICRSITGNGVRETLSILKETIPMDIVEIPTGTKVFDWEIPEEWNIKDAWIKNPEGEKIIDFRKLNLHVLNYSEPVNKIVDLAELKKHLFTIPEKPDWVPYRTSYYNRNWGFCMAHNQLGSLPNGNYHVLIDSAHTKGSLTYGEYFIEGKSNDEVLFSCHVCHPSLGNDNLSGIVLAAKLAETLGKMNNHFSYRFLFIPGTIGSIAWLSMNEDKLHNIKHGMVLTLLGDSTPFQYKKSRQDNAEIDQILEYLLQNYEGNKILDFSPYGYDERQFCSPGFDLPVGRLTRTPFAEFPEYHTSADNLNFISADNLSESLSFLLKIITTIEGNQKWINLSSKGEPQLGKRGLYAALGDESQHNDYQMALLWVLNLSDGNHSLLDIAKRSGIDFETIVQATERLWKAGLLKQKQ